MILTTKLGLSVYLSLSVSLTNTHTRLTITHSHAQHGGEDCSSKSSLSYFMHWLLITSLSLLYDDLGDEKHLSDASLSEHTLCHHVQQAGVQTYTPNMICRREEMGRGHTYCSRYALVTQTRSILLHLTRVINIKGDVGMCPQAQSMKNIGKQSTDSNRGLWKRTFLLVCLFSCEASPSVQWQNSHSLCLAHGLSRLPSSCRSVFSEEGILCFWAKLTRKSRSTVWERRLFFFFLFKTLTGEQPQKWGC